MISNYLTNQVGVVFGIPEIDIFLSDSLFFSMPSYSYYHDFVDFSPYTVSAPSKIVENPISELDFYQFTFPRDKDEPCSAWCAEWEKRNITSPREIELKLPSDSTDPILLVKSGKAAGVSGDTQKEVKLDLTPLPTQEVPVASDSICFFVGNQLVHTSHADGSLEVIPFRSSEKRMHPNLPQFEFSLEEESLKRLCARFYTLPTNSVIPAVEVPSVAKDGQQQTAGGNAEDS